MGLPPLPGSETNTEKVILKLRTEPGRVWKPAFPRRYGLSVRQRQNRNQKGSGLGGTHGGDRATDGCFHSEA